MPNWSNNAEGQTNNTVTTTGTSATGGTAFSQVSKSVTGQIVHSTTQAYRGTSSYLITAAAGDTAWFDWATTMGSFKGAIRAYCYVNTLAASLGDVFQLRNTTSSGKIQFRTDGKLQLQNAAGTVMYTSTNALSLSTWYRLEMQCQTDPSTTAGIIRFQYYLGESTTAIETFTNNATNAGTTALTNCRIGQITSTVTTMNCYWDEIVYNQGTIDPVGPVDKSSITGLASVTGLSSITF